MKILNKSIALIGTIKISQQLCCYCSSTAINSDKINLNLNNTNYVNNENKKLLNVAIIGEPNAGKSTFINSLVNSQVCPTSNKVHTTRKSTKAILTEGCTQIIFVDTPGLVSFKEFKRYNLEKSFLHDSKICMKEADVIGVIHDVHNPWTRDKFDSKLLNILEKNSNLSHFLILNKIDLLKSKRKLLELVRILTDNCLQDLQNSKLQIDPQKPTKSGTNQAGPWRHFTQIFMISSLNGDGIQTVKDYLMRMAKPSKWIYENFEQTDQPPETLIVNTVKATLLDFLPQEIPYKLKTKIEYFEIKNDGTIEAVVLIKCPTPRVQKLISGDSDGKLKQMNAVAQRTLMKAFHCNVLLSMIPVV